LCVAEARRQPDVHGLVDDELRLANADDLVLQGVEQDLLPDDTRVASEGLLPERIAEDHHIRSALHVFDRCEEPTERRLRADDRKQSRRRDPRLGRDRLAARRRQ
jgi:hypothetical protein